MSTQEALHVVGPAGTMEAAAGGESGAVNVDNDGQPDMVMTMEFQQPQTYPEARATHEQVASDPTLFAETLKDLHAALGVRDKVPKMGGTPLDLHLLYTTVTALGGCERVISRKQWRDVGAAFNFPPTITSVSFSLRKAYVTHLWDYEQVYFQGMGGQERVQPPIAAARPKDERDSSVGGAHGAGSSQQAPDSADTRPDKRARFDNLVTEFPVLPVGTPTAMTAMATTPGEAHAALVGTRGVVNVDGRFDCGYFVTIRLGRSEFKGMLYYPPPEHTLYSRTDVPTKAELNGTGGKGKGDLKDRDPFAPKPNKTPFNFFAVDARLKAKETFPGINQVDLTKKVGEMWQKASDYEKAPYLELANQDRARYQAELEAYNYRLAAQAAQAQALQAAQAVVAGAQALADNPPFNMMYIDNTQHLLQQQQQDGAAAAALAAAAAAAAQAISGPQQHHPPTSTVMLVPDMTAGGTGTDMGGMHQ
eukprot:jgi/Chrzof1/6311/Cz18g03030.t1